MAMPDTAPSPASASTTSSRKPPRSWRTALAATGAALLALLLLRRQLRPLVETADAVKAVVTQAIGGAFHGRIEQHTSDEVGEIAAQLNRLMAFLDEGIGTIGRRVSELMGHHQQPLITGNQLVTTTEMVEGLVEVSRFKQAIEEDQTKLEVYQRLASVLDSKYDFHRFSIYEVASSKNRMTPIAVDGAIGTAFYSTHAALGATREVWVVRGGFLYEVTTLKPLDTWLGEIIKTWKFTL